MKHMWEHSEGKPMKKSEITAAIYNITKDGKGYKVDSAKRSRGQRRRDERQREDTFIADLRQAGCYHSPYIKTSDRGGEYVIRKKSSNAEQFLKKQTSKRARRYDDMPTKGNYYRKLLDYWWTLY